MFHPVRRRVVGSPGRPSFDNPASKGKNEENRHMPAVVGKGRRRVRPALLKRVTITAVGLLIICLVFIYPLLTFLLGNGYNVEGGALGRTVDRWTKARYLTREDERRGSRIEDLGLRFPLVLLRSNRAEVPGYSTFLEEILSLQENAEIPLATATDSHSQEKRRLSWEKVQILEVPHVKSETQIDMSVMNRLYAANCRPGWLCHRCLNSGLYGSLSACETTCPPCYADTLCDSKQSPTKQVSIRVTKSCHGGNCDQSPTLIPRVIHQVWSQPLSTLDYPELVRIQNGWRNSGFRYQFYTAESSRSYVERHYPPRFLQAYDSIQNFDIQMDVFRLLVLFREGGLFSNVDLMLETNLQTFLTPSLSFFAARDDSTFDHCLWNGFIGAQAGHDILGKAIETVMNTVSRRLWMEDAEQDACRSVGREAELWKLRAQPEESLFGSCALGMATNEALGHERTMDKFPLGILPPGDTEGETLILLMSQADTGAFRCSDVHRNLLVASTNMMGLTTELLTSRSPSHALKLRSSARGRRQQEDAYGKLGASSDETIQFAYA